MNNTVLEPILQLKTDLPSLRRSICKRIQLAPPAIVQAVYVLLEQNHKDRIIRDLYKEIAKEGKPNE